MESLEILLRKATNTYTDEEKVMLATKKNEIYKKSLQNLKPNEILPGVMMVLEDLKEKGVKIAIGSSSANTPLILRQVGLENYFDAVADGNEIKNSKPDPEVFILAAYKLDVSPKDCLVVEDADSGIEAALAGNMKVLGVGFASKNPRAHKGVENLTKITTDEIVNI